MRLGGRVQFLLPLSNNIKRIHVIRHHVILLIFCSQETDIKAMNSDSFFRLNRIAIMFLQVTAVITKVRPLCMMSGPRW